MPKFNFTEQLNSPMPENTPACLGDGSVSFDSETDLGKLVKLGSFNNYVLAGAGDEIEGFIFSVEANTYNDGVSFGTVQKNKRKNVQVGAFHDGATNEALAVGDLVVADEQTGPGKDGEPRVRKGEPSVFIWRVIRLVSGSGVTGDTVLIERV